MIDYSESDNESGILNKSNPNGNDTMKVEF